MARALEDTTARLLAEQLRSAEQRAERYEAAQRQKMAAAASAAEMRRIAQQATG